MVKMLFFGDLKRSVGIKIGTYNTGIDTPHALSGMNNSAGSLGTIVGFYGQTLINNIGTLKSIGIVI